MNIPKVIISIQNIIFKYYSFENEICLSLFDLALSLFYEEEFLYEGLFDNYFFI